jgi:protein-ribulosamine 3-kinase
MLSPALQPVRARVESSLGSTIVSMRTLSGGDINDAYALKLANGDQVFLKTNASCPEGMFGAEARGLEWLRSADAIRIPRVLASSDDPDAPFLALELLTPGRRVSNFDEEFGRSLAALHRSGSESFGLDHSNFIGRLPQKNTSQPDWPTFYRQCRLQPQLEVAASQLKRPDRQLFDRLFDRMAELVSEPEPPSRLHGDLWGGNLHCDEAGHPVLIDPAVYGGNREMDLAMMRLFGGFSPRVFEAYNESFPLSAGHEERVSLYQLYPLLVHLNLFGGGYLASVRSHLTSLVQER